MAARRPGQAQAQTQEDAASETRVVISPGNGHDDGMALDVLDGGSVVQRRLAARCGMTESRCKGRPAHWRGPYRSAARAPWRRHRSHV